MHSCFYFNGHSSHTYIPSLTVSKKLHSSVSYQCTLVSHSMMSHIHTHCQFPLNAHSSHIHAHTLTFSLMYTPLTFIHPHSLCPRNTPLRFSHTHSLPLMQIPLTFTIYHSLHCNFKQITLLPDSLTHPLTVSHKYHSFNIPKHTHCHCSFNLMHTSLTLYHPHSNSHFSCKIPFSNG